ncbi:Sphingolipid delta(4)-desaturase DES1 [Cichlidogyrus casuarinus]|uniref:Sphingolipid delta(4)-desaturase DES1 n=1 Tax=Cichlidogyrus casuarinus TaxID=1844966 RepID=A0ABD2PWV6_9PLAT
MRIEVKLFSRPMLRIVWLFLHPLIHGVRPFFKSPKPMTLWEVNNIAVQIIFDLLVIKFLGYYALGYMIIGTLLGLGPHPMAGHFISEHYLFADNQATHSYYGPLNPILFNVGYHIEHHDFPYIPHTRLHLVKAFAPEYYDHLPHHTSLCRVLWDFIWKAELGPQARSIIYDNKTHPEIFKDMPNTLGVLQADH